MLFSTSRNLMKCSNVVSGVKAQPTRWWSRKNEVNREFQDQYYKCSENNIILFFIHSKNSPLKYLRFEIYMYILWESHAGINISKRWQLYLESTVLVSKNFCLIQIPLYSIYVIVPMKKQWQNSWVSINFSMTTENSLTIRDSFQKFFDWQNLSHFWKTL